MQKQLYETLSGAESDQPIERRNFFLHAICLTLTKVADGLIDPKIVLSWLVTALGAPAAFVGFLVPIREAGALLPQLMIAPFVRNAAIRKTFWALGSMGQGVSVIGIGLVAFSMEGAAAGWAILGLLVVFSVCRAICSTSHKDVLGKTVKKTTRGAAMGIAASAAAVAVLAFGALLALGIIPRDVTAIAVVILCAGAVWFAAGALFLKVEEDESDIDESADLFSLKALAEPLRNDTQLRIFIAARALLVPTALAPPFLIAMAAGEKGETSALGPFILASALASILSGYVWGRLSDRSSRWTFIIAGGLSAAVLAVAAFVALGSPSLWLVVGLLFVAQIGYEGVRSARKVHLVDMADEDRRAVYTALSNTIIGVVLLAGGVLGVIAQVAGIGAALAVSAALVAAGVAVAFGLDEVQ